MLQNKISKRILIALRDRSGQMESGWKRGITKLK